MLPPCDFGAPSKFTSWRSEQLDAMMRLTDSDKRFVCFNMPTGSGKSIAAAMSSHLTGARTLILTANKALQTQYMRDELAHRDIRGQNNYECLAVRPFGPLRQHVDGRSKMVMVDKAPCHVGVYCWMKFGGCLYYDDLKAAREADIVVTNYSYWLALGRAIRAGRSEEQLGVFDRIVHDEAHAAPDEVCKALRIELSRDALGELLALTAPAVASPVDMWRTWSEHALFRWGDEMDRMKAEFNSEWVDTALIHEWKQMQTLGQSLEQISDIHGEWKVTSSDKTNDVIFRPVWPTEHTEELLFRGIPNHMFLSATVVPKTLDELGVTEDLRTYVEYDSSFPVDRRPVIIYQFAPKIDRNMSEDDEVRWMQLIDHTIEARADLGYKGIIHCVSYARMERIKVLSKFRRLFITHGNGNGEVQDAVERFKKAGPSAILLSPSVTEGEDFPDDLCRYVYIPKLPFGDTRDPVSARREEIDPGYGLFRMAISLMQSAGRGMRSKADWCETIIGDGHASWALPKAREKGYMPKYFTDAWKWAYEIPEPLRFT